MKLTIVIPAYNEQDAIASTIERCLAARETIVRRSPVDDVEIIVVSDGSTDRTVEIASGYDQIQLVIFEKNRGYGAAIKRGFSEGTGDLVSFLDADGTCDPNFFVTLCTDLCDQNADVAIGSRLGPESRMPPIRRLGNRIYAVILSALSNRVVSDTASGMRVIRRDALPKLYPLPDGLHFTPAMSARVLMDDQLKIVEHPMRYEERIGESKLHVLHDGVRFLRTILEMCLMWQPSKLFGGAAALCLMLTLVLALHPIEAWMRGGALAAGLKYRLLFCALAGTFGVTLLSMSLICTHLRHLLGVRDDTTTRSARLSTFVWAVVDRVYSPVGVGVITCVAIPLMVWLIGGAMLTDGGGVRWGRSVLGGLIGLGWGQMVATLLVVHLLRFHTARTPALVTQQATPRREALRPTGAARSATPAPGSTHRHTGRRTSPPITVP